VRYKYYRKNGLEPPKRRSQSKSAHKFIQYNNRGAFSFKAPARLPAGTAFSRTACRRPPAGRLLAEQAVQRADWWREVRSVAQAAWQAAWQAPASLAGSLAGACQAACATERTPGVCKIYPDRLRFGSMRAKKPVFE